jgi:surfeit locus 1 family protein
VITRTRSARTVVAIVGLVAFGALFAALGDWQLERAEQSRATRAQFAGGSAAEPLPMLPSALDAELRFKRIEVRGRYVAEPQFLLDNMLHEGAAGYHVLTALRVPGVSERVLVNRGWVSAGGDRSVLPDVAVDAAERTIAGRLERLPRPGLRLGAAGSDGGGATVVVQYPTAADLAERLEAPVFDYQVLLDPGALDGYVRDWRPPGIAPERHLGYAGQWLALSLGAVAAAVVMAVRARGAGDES